jgi:hypothetical protein
MGLRRWRVSAAAACAGERGYHYQHLYQQRRRKAVSWRIRV